MRITHPTLSNMPGIEHGFFTRNGGTSSDTYESLNCGYGSDDSREQVRRNRARVAQSLEISEANLITAYQVHSADALAIEGPFSTSEAPKVDGLATRTPGIAVAILTADCGPLLFADPAARVVAAAHAGWRGAFEGIIESTLQSMVALGAERSNITAILGPTISKDNYEVDEAFKQRFLERDENAAQFFSKGKRDGRAQFDLPAFILERLTASGVGQAINLDRCTYADEGQFFSYRRSTHRQEPDYGRQISAITLL